MYLVIGLDVFPDHRGQFVLDLDSVVVQRTPTVFVWTFLQRRLNALEMKENNSLDDNMITGFLAITAVIAISIRTSKNNKILSYLKTYSIK